MEILKKIRRYWTAFGYYYDENTSLTRRIFGIFANVLTMAALAMLNCFSIIYLCTERNLSMEKVFHCLVEITVATTVTLTYILLNLEKGKIIDLTKKFQNDVNDQLNVQSIVLFENVEKESEEYIRWPLRFCYVFYNAAFPLLQFSFWIYQAIFSDVDPTRWPNIYTMW